MVRRIDHVLVEAADEDALVAYLTDELGLPLAWPVAQWGFIREGGVGLGNANVGCNHQLDPNSDPKATLRALAFEPAGSVDAAIAELGRRGLGSTDAMPTGPLDLPDELAFAPWRAGWTVAMPIGAPWDPVPFLCAYNHNVDERRRDDQAGLDAVDGGRLGVVELRAIVVPVDDTERAQAEWAALLSPIPQSQPGHFQPADGPAMIVRAGKGPAALLLGVRSLSAAERALRDIGIGYTGRDELRLDPADALGLDIRLIA